LPGSRAALAQYAGGIERPIPAGNVAYALARPDIAPAMRVELKRLMED